MPDNKQPNNINNIAVKQKLKKQKNNKKHKSKNSGKYVTKTTKTTKTTVTTKTTEIPEWLIGTEIKSKEHNIIIKGFDINVTGKRILLNSDLVLVKGRKYGLVGKNGVGKSTLLRYISSGLITNFPSDLSVSHMNQEIGGSDKSAVEVVVHSDIFIDRLDKYEQELLAEMEEGTAPENVNELLDLIYEKQNELEIWNIEGRARSILKGIGFTDELMNLPVEQLSGGWKMRVSLASALFVESDILCLDEPTNHLDFPAVQWLLKYLVDCQKTVIIVSHNRHFLNEIVTDIIHFQNLKLIYYHGDFNSFMKVREDYLKSQGEYSSYQQKHKLSFPNPKQLKSDVTLLHILKVKFSYKDPILLNDISVLCNINSRIGILGKNGVGKSTLIKLITGDLKPINGNIYLYEKVSTAVFTQHYADSFDMDRTPIELLQEIYKRITNQEAEEYFNSFGIDIDLLKRKSGLLSGGQRTRVAFAILTYFGPHIIIMDEPTNHLDHNTIDALIEGLKSFKGAVIVISHDQYFIEKVADEYWGIKDSELKIFHDFVQAKRWSYNLI